MQKLRSLHLYLGCIFAPLLLFFAVSGIWQMFGLRTPLLRLISTIHTSHELRSGGGLSSLSLRIFVIAMTVSFIVTTILGVMLALKYGKNRRAVYFCLAFGIIFPLALIFIRIFANGSTPSQ
jgi:hypothetical protein